MLISPVQAGTRSDSCYSTNRSVDSIELQSFYKSSSFFHVFDIKCLTETSTTDVGNPGRVLFAQFSDLVNKVFTRVVSVLDEIIFQNNVVLFGGQKSSYRVTHPGIEMSVRNLQFEMIRVVKPTCLELF